VSRLDGEPVSLDPVNRLGAWVSCGFTEVSGAFDVFCGVVESSVEVGAHGSPQLKVVNGKPSLETVG
jgi:hypothetical protein